MDDENRIVLRVDAEDPLTAVGATEALRSFADLTVTQVADNGTVADVVVVLTEAIDSAALARIRAAHAHHERPVVLVVTGLDDDGVLAAVQAGARAILRRHDARPERLAEMVRGAVRGEGTVPVEVLGTLLDRLGGARATVPGPRIGRISDREAAVLRLVSEGLETAEIAEELHYSERTIKGVMHDVTMRLNLRNRAHAVAYAMRQGLI